MDQHKLSGHHLATAQKVLSHPVGHNIAWHDAVSLISDLGTITEEPNHRFTVSIGTETETFDRPRGDDLDEQQVVDLRRMLTNIGITLETLRR